jgi:hypothetical protein
MGDFGDTTVSQAFIHILQYTIQCSQSVTRLLHHHSSKIALIASRVITTKVLRPVGV